MNTANKPLMSLCAADIMTRTVTVIPRRMSLQAAARLLAVAGVTGAPIIDDEGHCVGVLSATDFMHAVEMEEPTSQANTEDADEAISQPWQIPKCSPARCACVEDYMTKDPVLVSPDTRLGELAQIMVDAHIHRAIVVQPVTQAPCGIVSSMDILGALVRLHQTAPIAVEDPCLEVLCGALN